LDRTPSAAQVLALQRSVGNHATQQILARTKAPSQRVGGNVLQRFTYGEGERQQSQTSRGAAARHPPGPLPPTLIVLADFAPSATQLKPAHRELLTALMHGEHLATRARVTSISGYTDGVGDDAGNAPLRQGRADAARAFLSGEGFPAAALGPAQGVGAGVFLAGNATATDRASNRAVAINLEAVPQAVAPEDGGADAGTGTGGMDGGTPPISDGGMPVAGAPGLDGGTPPVAAPPPPPVMEVDVGDEYDATGWLEGFVRVGEVYMTDVNSMVTNTLTALGTGRMSRLNIRAHANPTGMRIGTDWVDVTTFSTYQARLARLSGRFAPGGFVHLQGCEVGQDEPLMRLFAATFGVNVYAGTGSQNNILGFNMGSYVMCNPAGRCTPSSRP
jgi:outer membrane protein OmpA-like peptidoglycan-associated protein